LCNNSFDHPFDIDEKPWVAWPKEFKDKQDLIAFNKEKFSEVSQTIIRGLLRADPVERFSIEEVLAYLLYVQPENKLIRIFDGYPIDTK
jgi:hypothetical protein